MSSQPTEQQQPPPPQSPPPQETPNKPTVGENHQAEEYKPAAPTDTPSSHDEHRNHSHSPSRSRSRNRSRSHSHSRSRSPTGGRSSSTKGEICRDYLRGACSRGANCRFRHEADGETPSSGGSDAERVYCKDFLNNKCSRNHCRYIHCTRADESFFLAHHRFPPGSRAEGELYYRFDEFRPLLGPHATRPPPPGNNQYRPEMEPMFNEPGPGPMEPGPMIDPFHFPIELEPCKDFLQHKCLRGGRCRFRHVPQEQADRERRYLELKRELAALDAEGVGQVFEEFARSQRFGPMGPPGGPMGGPPPGPMQRPPMGLPLRQGGPGPGPMGPRGPAPMQQGWGGGQQQQQRGPPPNFRQQQQQMQMPQQGMQMQVQMPQQGMQMQVQRPMRPHGFDSNMGQQQQQQQQQQQPWNDGWVGQQQQQPQQQGPLYGESQGNYGQGQQLYDPAQGLATQQQFQQQQYIEQKLVASAHLQQQQPQQQPQQQQLVQYPLGSVYRPRG